MHERLEEALARAIEAGVLPASATPPGHETRPWPVVLLTALGAWLAAIPLLGVVGLLLGDLITRSAGPYGVGLLVLGAAVVVLRARNLPLFVEQLAVPALLVGGGSLAFGVFRDLPERAGALVLALMALGIALAVARPWLRVLLGALMAGLVGFALLGPRGIFFGRSHGVDEAWLACHGLLLLWLLALWVQRLQVSVAALLESLAAGWLLVTLVSLAWLAGMTFMVGGMTGAGFAGALARETAGEPLRGGLPWVMQAFSAGLGLLAFGVCVRAWPLLRQPVWGVVALVGPGLSWLLPTLGAVLLALAFTASTRRWLLSAAAGVATAWIMGSFYYLLTWPLATKALVLVAAGAALGALAWWLMRRSGGQEPAAAPVAAARLDRPAAAIAFATLATLGVAAVAIWQKQDVIAHGQPVFVELAPVDPRSLMQGDYMQLSFRLPEQTWKLGLPDVIATRPKVVARRDARGVARLLHPHNEGVALAADEFLLELTPKNGSWILVTDAWFFKEGEGKRWAAAKYGEFRVMPDGRALLVGMADAELKPIRP